jgi:hypothetical protein
MPFGEIPQYPMRTKARPLFDAVGAWLFWVAIFASISFLAWLGRSFLEAITGYFGGSDSVFSKRPWLSIFVVLVMYFADYDPTISIQGTYNTDNLNCNSTTGCTCDVRTCDNTGHC